MLSGLLNRFRARALGRVGRRSWVQGNLDTALKTYDEALSLDASQPELWYCRGWINARLDRLKEAEEDWSRAIQLDRRHAVAYWVRGWVRLSTGRSALALKDLDQAISLNPCLAGALLQRAHLRSRQGNYAGAIADSTQALLTERSNPSAYQLRAFAYLAETRLEEAAADYSRAIDIDPRSSEAYFGRALACFSSGRWDSALRDLQTARDLVARTELRAFCVLFEWMVALRRQKELRPSEKPRFTESHPADLGHPIARLFGCIVLDEIPPAFVDRLIETSPEEFRDAFRCQAAYYRGFRSLLDGEPARAREHFTEVLGTNCRDHFEYSLALVELRALDALRPAFPRNT